MHQQCQYLKDFLAGSQEHPSPEVTDSKGDEQNPLRMAEQGNISLQRKYLPFALYSHPWGKLKYPTQPQYCIKVTIP